MFVDSLEIISQNVLKEQFYLVLNQFVYVGDVSGDTEADNTRAKTSLVLQKASPPENNLSKNQRQALHSLKEDTQITILPADKGRPTVFLNKEDYIKKCNDHLDSGFYIELQKDSTQRI